MRKLLVRVKTSAGRLVVERTDIVDDKNMYSWAEMVGKYAEQGYIVEIRCLETYD